jgi:CBS domain-containing protein
MALLQPRQGARIGNWPRISVAFRKIQACGERFYSGKTTDPEASAQRQAGWIDHGKGGRCRISVGNSINKGDIAMKVKDIMGYSVRSVGTDTPLIDVVSLMCLYRYSGLPVVDSDNKLIGFIAEKDVLARMFPSLEDLMDGGMASIDMEEMMTKYKDVLRLNVSELMTRGAISTTPETHILRAASVMARHKFRRIPVTDGGKLVGMISMGDVHKAIFKTNIADAVATANIL